MTKVDILSAHRELIIELFGREPDELSSESVTRTTYTEAMKKIQRRYGLEQGHPDFLEWVFTCVGRSPRIVEDEEPKGAGGK